MWVCIDMISMPNLIIYGVLQFMAIVFIPALVALLEAKEKDFGRELTREDVESI